MKLPFRNQWVRGFSALELVVVLVVLFVLIASLLLPWLARRNARSSRIRCISNLKIVGLAFRMWSNDNGDRFPMAVSTNDGGTLELGTSGQAWRHFQVVSNELNSPKVLVCENDPKRFLTSRFDSGFGNKNISYFLGLDTTEDHPQTILTGDRNIIGGTKTEGNIMFFRSNSLGGWSGETHTNWGNICLADGSVQQTRAEELQRLLSKTTNEWIRLSMPFVP
jgi:prepilin-type processing-associated H-X9-DG protein